jgi:hypothetical protein
MVWLLRAALRVSTGHVDTGKHRDDCEGVGGMAWLLRAALRVSTGHVDTGKHRDDCEGVGGMAWLLRVVLIVEKEQLILHIRVFYKITDKNVVQIF